VKDFEKIRVAINRSRPKKERPTTEIKRLLIEELGGVPETEKEGFYCRVSRKLKQGYNIQSSPAAIKKLIQRHPEW
jgi:hypothetical protein